MSLPSITEDEALHDRIQELYEQRNLLFQAFAVMIGKVYPYAFEVGFRPDPDLPEAGPDKSASWPILAVFGLSSKKEISFHIYEGDLIPDIVETLGPTGTEWDGSTWAPEQKDYLKDLIKAILIQE